jgi:hypothetical protein
MRRLSILLLSLAVTIVVSCSNDGTATSTVAAVEVSGSSGTPVESGGFDVFEDGTSSDARLVGTYKLQIECDITEDGDTTIADCTGPNTLTNDGGTWDGACEGTSTWTSTEPDHVHVFDCTYLGSGDYAGLRFTQHMEGIDYPWSYTGTIEPVG